jgi:RNA 2',3'-cyclic 3'-phosphodiesterase
MSTRRLFFAFWPDDAMREALSVAVDGAMKAVRGGRPVPLGNLHVTLAFLGSVPETSLDHLIGLAREVSGVGEPAGATIDMRLDRIEHWRRAEILCAAATRMPARAEEFSGTLKSALVAADFRPDLKPFRAHVTLARQVQRAPPDLVMPAVTWSFGEFALIESRTLPEGSSYSIVASWALCGSSVGVAVVSRDVDRC